MQTEKALLHREVREGLFARLCPEAGKEINGVIRLRAKKAENPEKKKTGKFSRKKIIRLVIVLIVAAALLFAAVRFVLPRFAETGESTLTSFTVTRGDITTSITSSGTVEPIEQYDIVSMVKGDILSDNVTVGQTVSKGELLYQIDSSDAYDSIEKAEISLEKQQLNYDQTVENNTDHSVIAPIGGVITGLYVSEGDEVSKGAKIADITESATLTLTVPFHVGDAAQISSGMTAEITLSSTAEKLTGTVSRVATGSYVGGYGAQVTDVEISFANPGAVRSVYRHGLL